MGDHVWNCSKRRAGVSIAMSQAEGSGFPGKRMRRTRFSAARRRLVAETTLSAASLVYPVFVLEGEGIDIIGRAGDDAELERLLRGVRPTVVVVDGGTLAAFPHTGPKPFSD